MSTLLGKKYDPRWKGDPPRMWGKDLAIYRRWRSIHLRNVIALYFDVGVGSGAAISVNSDPALIKSWLRITQKRIDTIAEYNDRIDIIEFRREASPTSVGRLLMYGMLYAEAPPILKPTTLMLVSDLYDPEVDLLADKYKIKYLIV